MVFGKSFASPDDSETQVPENIIDVEENEEQRPTSGASGSQKTSDKDTTRPLLEEVKFIATGGSRSGGAKVWVCNHCQVTFTSSYTRIHTHFFGAQPGKRADIKRCPVMLKDREKLQRLLSKVKEAERGGAVSKSLKNSLLSKNATSRKGKGIEESFGLMERHMVDMKIIRALCANGIPFNVLRNPQFIEAIESIKRAPEGYKPPSSEKARTVLLDECVREVDKDLTQVKDTWYTDGVSIVSDGWTNVKHKPLINIIAVNARGAMFMYAEDFSKVEKTGVEISKCILRAIEAVGPYNVLQVVTDNAANCKAAGKEVEKVHKHIFWSPCCVHTLNLIFKDLANEFYWMNNTYNRGKTIVKFFLNHTRALDIFRETSKVDLLRVAKTRFASHYILLKRIMDCREALSTTIILNSWREWVKKWDENTKLVGEKVSETIKDDSFWDDVENVLAITKPIFLLVKFCDGEGPKMGEIYEKMDNMLGEIEDIMQESIFSSYYPKVKKIIVTRWEKMTIPLHCLGFALNPRFYDRQYLQKLAPGGIRRKAPNLDKEVMVGVMDAFKRISENEEDERVLREQFVTFHMKKGTYSRVATQTDAVTMDAIDWWSTYGSETPELAEVARKVLSQPISSSSAERNWSTYSYIHNVKRNRLNVQRADQLVFVHSNIRLLDHFSDSYKTGPHKNWDIDPESTYIEGSSTRLAEMTWENLGEDMEHGKGKRQRVD